MKKRKVFGCILACAGAALLFGSLGLNLYQHHTAEEMIESFYEQTESQSEMTSDTQEDTKEEESDVLCVLRIPKIDSTNPVVEGTSSSSLSAALGHETSTAYPGEVGNCVIAGHRNYTFGKFFNRLDEIEIGDLLYIDVEDDTYTYEVTEVKVVEPTEVEILESDGETEQLTLYTCTPIYVATHRLVIVAERVE